MDRKDFAVCAGLFVSLAAVCSGGCGGQSASAPTSQGPPAPLARSIAGSDGSRVVQRPQPAPQVVEPVCETLVPQSANVDDVVPVRVAEARRESDGQAPVAVTPPQAPLDEPVPHSSAQELHRSAPTAQVRVVERRDSELSFVVSSSTQEPVAEEVGDAARAIADRAPEAEDAAEVIEVERSRSNSRTNVSVEVEAAAAGAGPTTAVEGHAPSIHEPGRGEMVSHEAVRAENIGNKEPQDDVSTLAPLRIDLTDSKTPDRVTIKFAVPDAGSKEEKPTPPSAVEATKRGIAPVVITPIEVAEPKIAKQHARPTQAPARSAAKRDLANRAPVKHERTRIEAASAAKVNTEPTLAKEPIAVQEGSGQALVQQDEPKSRVDSAPRQGEPTLANPALEKRELAAQDPLRTPAVVEQAASPPATEEVAAAPAATEPTVAKLEPAIAEAAPSLAKTEPTPAAEPMHARPETPAPARSIAKVVPAEQLPLRTEAASAENSPLAAQQPVAPGTGSSRSESTKYGNPKGEVAHQEALKRPVAGPLASPREMLERGEVSRHTVGLGSAAERSARLVADISRADHRVAHGFQLAERGAIYLAKAEFTAALKLIAQAKDIEDGTRVHGRAVTSGLIALKESGDFVKQMVGIDDIDVARIISAHRTPVLKGVDVSEMAPTVAAQYYYAFAQNELATAINSEMVGSMAMYGLGKATLVAAGANSHQMEYTGQAMAYYQAALAVEPRNVRAANELGVLFATNGQLKQARDMLTRSASIAPNVTTFQNLAVVHNRMGDPRMAEQLREQAREMKQSGKDPATPSVQWVDPATFAGITPATDGTSQPPLASAKDTPAARPAIQPASPPAGVAQRINEWLPQPLRR
jgi:tetratricopeptide (TPR) repeat protein